MQTFGLSWDHGKKRIGAALALLMLAFSLAAASTAHIDASIEAGKKDRVTETVVEVQSSTYKLFGSTWG